MTSGFPSTGTCSQYLPNSTGGAVVVPDVVVPVPVFVTSGFALNQLNAKKPPTTTPASNKTRTPAPAKSGTLLRGFAGATRGSGVRTTVTLDDISTAGAGATLAGGGLTGRGTLGGLVGTASTVRTVAAFTSDCVPTPPGDPCVCE